MISYYASIYSLLPPSGNTEEPPEEQFKKAYLSGDTGTAKSYLDKINVNYQEGCFLINAVRKDDDGMLKALLDKGANVGLAGALRKAACDRRVKCVKELINHVDKIDSASLKDIINQGSHWHAQAIFANDARTRGFFTKEKLAIIERKMKQHSLSPTIPSTAPPLASSISPTKFQGEDLLTQKPHESPTVTKASQETKAILGQEKSIKPFNPLAKPFNPRSKKTVGKEEAQLSSDIKEVEDSSLQRINSASHALAALNQIDMDAFITQEEIRISGISAHYPSLIKIFQINLEVLGTVALARNALPSNQLHHLEHHLFSLALLELSASELYIADKESIREAACNTAIVKCFARSENTLSLSETFPIVLWKLGNTIALIDPMASLFGLSHQIKQIAASLEVKFKRFNFILPPTTLSHDAHFKLKDDSSDIAINIARAINMKQNATLKSFKIGREMKSEIKEMMEEMREMMEEIREMEEMEEMMSMKIEEMRDDIERAMDMIKIREKKMKSLEHERANILSEVFAEMEKAPLTQ